MCWREPSHSLIVAAVLINDSQRHKREFGGMLEWVEIWVICYTVTYGLFLSTRMHGVAVLLERLRLLSSGSFSSYGLYTETYTL